jgi:tRNA (guanine-N7-)-methyltransferase
MSKNKLAKFADMETYHHVFQYPFGKLKEEGSFPQKGKWSEFFKNNNPIVLELGCGKGEYTVELARLFPNKNFIGVDIKGARMWTGAKMSLEEGLNNVAFLRTNIELIEYFFAAGEVAEIWITFPDPQMKKATKRLTSTWFMQRYQNIMATGGLIHLKTDSPFLYTYTSYMVRDNQYPVVFQTDDLYHSNWVNEILSIKTYYEKQWLERGLTIKYIQFELTPKTSWKEPVEDIEEDTYRSFNRSKRSAATPNTEA